jgi:hypothetical protein
MKLDSVYRCDSCKRIFQAFPPNDNVVQMDISVGEDCSLYMEICTPCAWRIKIALRNVMTDLDVLSKPKTLR